MREYFALESVALSVVLCIRGSLLPDVQGVLIDPEVTVSLLMLEFVSTPWSLSGLD